MLPDPLRPSRRAWSRRGLSRGVAVAAAVLVSLGLAACNGSGTAEPGSTAPPVRSTPSGTAAPSGSASPSASAASVKPSANTDAIKVSGKFGDSPKVSVDAPFAITKTQTRVLSPGDGATVTTGTIQVNYYGLNARTGEKFDESYSTKKPVAFALDQVIPGFGSGLKGQKVGSRVLIAITGEDGYDSSGGNAQIGVQVGDTLLFVVDIVSTQLSGPQGTTVTPPGDLPKVTDADGVPSITVPKTDAPTKLVVQPLITGTGAKVTAADQVVTNYLGVSWTDGATVFDTYKTKTPDTSAIADTIPGLTQALVGQKVGSRVLVVVPPELGYPDGNADPKIDKGTTLVFVVDILFASAAG